MAILFQKWRDLCFLHWQVDPDSIQKTLPRGLSVDTCEGKAWLGVVPFIMKGIRPPLLPPFPGLSGFPELNLRTYVRDCEGLPGVWFYSLDADQRVAVWIARTCFDLPYVHARIHAHIGKDGFMDVSSRRKTEAQPLTFRYRPGKFLSGARDGSLEQFLVERYRLFAWNPAKERLRRGLIANLPYSLYEAEVDAWSTRIFSQNGFPEPSRPPDHALYAPGVDVTVERMETVCFV